MFVEIDKENNSFMISNKLKDGYESDIVFLFGYCLTETTIIKNREIDVSEYNYIKQNRNTLSVW